MIAAGLRCIVHVVQVNERKDDQDDDDDDAAAPLFSSTAFSCVAGAGPDSITISLSSIFLVGITIVLPWSSFNITLNEPASCTVPVVAPPIVTFCPFLNVGCIWVVPLIIAGNASLNPYANPTPTPIAMAAAIPHMSAEITEFRIASPICS